MTVSDYQEPTQAETVLRKALEKYNLPALYDQTYCFDCHSYFDWSNRWPPEYCMNCGVMFEKATFCRPDIILVSEIGCKEIVQKKLAVIYVNGGIHYKSHKNIRKDYMQVQDLLNDGVEVYILLNEDLIDEKGYGKNRGGKKQKKADRPKIAEAESIARDIRDIFSDASGERYQEYRKSKTFQERFRKY
jgi:hypothetical protein